MLKFFRFSLILSIAYGLFISCEPAHDHGGGHGHDHGGGHSHDHGDSDSHESKPKSPKPASRTGPHKGRVVNFAKVNWELAGGPQAKLYLLDRELKQQALKAIPAELVVETPNGQKIAKFTHAKDHLVANLAYDPAKQSAMVMMTIKGKTELIDFAQ